MPFLCTNFDFLVYVALTYIQSSNPLECLVHIFFTVLEILKKFCKVCWSFLHVCVFYKQKKL